MESQVRGSSHSQRYRIALQFRGNYAGLRFERNFLLGYSDLVCETREATRAVATHLRFSAIGVEVTHPKICAVSPSFEQQDPVGADAAMPITQLRDLAAIQPNVSHPAVDKDEIVSGAIHFREAQHRIRLTHQPHAGNAACPCPGTQTRSCGRRIARFRFGSYL